MSEALLTTRRSRDWASTAISVTISLLCVYQAVIEYGRWRGHVPTDASAIIWPLLAALFYWRPRHD